MHRPHLTHNLRSLLFLLGVAGLLGGVGVLWWANRTGLPASWRAAIEREVSKNGPRVSIGGLRYVPFKGVIATDVRVFSLTEPPQEISRLERVVLDFDKTKLARGQVHLNKIQLDDARLEMPVDPTDPASEILHVSGANGTILMPGDKRLEIRDARGEIAGIDVTLDARIIGYRQVGAPPPDPEYLRKRRELAAKIIGELGKWRFDERHPPAVQIRLDGDTNDLSSLSATISLQILKMEKSGHQLDEVAARAEISGDLVTVSSLRATDERGTLEGRLDYDIGGREGRFDLDSTLDIPQLLTSWLGAPALPGVEISGVQTLEAGGSFTVAEDHTPHFDVTGHVRCADVRLKGVQFDAVEAAFAWDGQSAFLRDILLRRADGEARGKALVEWPLVRLALSTTLPIPVCRPFFADLPLGKVLADFAERKGAAVSVRLEGGFDTTNRDAWAYTGGGTVRKVTYKGVPVRSADCQFSLNHHELDFHDGTVDFDYSGYPLREAFGGPAAGIAKIGRIRFTGESKLVEVEDVTGAMWAAPMVRLFAPKIADSLEQYRFHRPPEMTASGIVDVTPAGRTALEVTFQSEHPADYRFLGENLTLGAPSGKVTIRGGQVHVGDLQTEAFGGPVTAVFDSTEGGKLAGELTWTQLSLPALASTYGFHLKGGGDVTGRLDFSITGGDVRTMKGKGLLALDHAELFAVPMFGPLTSLVGAVLNNDRAGIQKAKNAFCTFRISRGRLRTEDFQTATRSLDFTGAGTIDLAEKSLDMTIRMNARGLLKLLTIPLRSFAGLFQFHGTGPLGDPHWESMKFTRPDAAPRDAPAAVPRAVPVPASE